MWVSNFFPEEGLTNSIPFKISYLTKTVILKLMNFSSKIEEITAMEAVFLKNPNDRKDLYYGINDCFLQPI